MVVITLAGCNESPPLSSEKSTRVIQEYVNRKLPSMCPTADFWSGLELIELPGWDVPKVQKPTYCEVDVTVKAIRHFTEARAEIQVELRQTFNHELIRGVARNGGEMLRKIRSRTECVDQTGLQIDAETAGQWCKKRGLAIELLQERISEINAVVGHERIDFRAQFILSFDKRTWNVLSTKKQGLRLDVANE